MINESDLDKLSNRFRAGGISKELEVKKLNKFIEALNTYGFEMKLVKHHWSVIRNGVKFEFRYHYVSGIWAKVKSLTEKGGWSHNIGWCKSGSIGVLNSDLMQSTYDITKAVALMLGISNEYTVPKQIPRSKPVRSKKDLPEPLTFSNSVGMLEAYKTDLFTRNMYSVIEECEVTNVVGINGRARPDPSIISTPDEKVWFHLKCRNSVLATFDIISDGEVFHPADRYNSGKITRKLKPKKSVDLSRMNAKDKVKVQAAIEKFASKI